MLCLGVVRLQARACGHHSLVPLQGDRTRSFPSARGGQIILPPVG